jgi:hypothetical protein
MDESKTPPTHLGSCRYLTLCRGVLEFARHSISILYHEVPNPSLTIRDFFIAVGAPVLRGGMGNGRLSRSPGQSRRYENFAFAAAAAAAEEEEEEEEEEAEEEEEEEAGGGGAHGGVEGEADADSVGDSVGSVGVSSAGFSFSGRRRQVNSRRVNPKGTPSAPGLLAVYAREHNSPKPLPTALIHCVTAAQLPNPDPKPSGSERRRQGAFGRASQPEAWPADDEREREIDLPLSKQSLRGSVAMARRSKRTLGSHESTQVVGVSV